MLRVGTKRKHFLNDRPLFLIGGRIQIGRFFICRAEKKGIVLLVHGREEYLTAFVFLKERKRVISLRVKHHRLVDIGIKKSQPVNLIICDRG